MAAQLGNKPKLASPAGSGSGHNSGGTTRERPCDACRKRKVRCLLTEESATCVLCKSRSLECTFLQDPPRKRKRPEAEGSNHRLANPRNQTKIPAIPNARVPVNDYTRLSGPSLLKQTLGHQNRQFTSYIGAATEYDTQLLSRSHFDVRDEYASPLGTLRRATHQTASKQTHFIVHSDNAAEVKEEMANLDAIEAIVTPHGSALVDLYFRIVHPSFPILHKNVFLEKHGRTYRELTPLGLAAVYILALNWWSYSLELSSLPKPNVKELENLIPKILADCYHRPKISDLQGGLVLSQRPDGDSWAMTGQLVAMAQNLGIHTDCSEWRVPDWEIGVRKRVAWALFAQDKWGALIHGRPSHITDDDWDVRPLEVHDFPETAKDDDDKEGSVDVEKGRLTFVHLISLTEILANILDTFFTLKGMRNTTNVLEALEKAKPLQIRLKSWYSNLPSCLSIDETKSRKLSSTGYLHLCYFAAEITLHRAIIRYQDTDTDEDLRLITRAAARVRFVSAVEFVKRLKPEHLQSFWYFASKINLAIIGTFGSILLATSCDNEEREFYRSQLAEYRWILRISSTAAEFMKYAVGILDASAAFLAEFGTDSTPWSGSRDHVQEGAQSYENSIENSIQTGCDGNVTPSDLQDWMISVGMNQRLDSAWNFRGSD
ncbi:transcriptional activator protein DAL81 [Lipomyces kononenkoae]